jgi:hypothetical protein
MIAGLPFGILPGGGGIEFVSQSTFSSGGTASTSHNIPAPSDPKAGDFLLMLVSATGINLTPFSSSGWTFFQNITASNVSFGLAHKFTGASEPSSYTVTINQSRRFGGVIVRYRGASTLVQQSSALTTGSVSLSGVQSGSALVYAAMRLTPFSTSVFSTPPANYTERVDVGFGGVSSQHTVADRLDAPAGNTGSVRNTWDATNTESQQVHALLEIK